MYINIHTHHPTKSIHIKEVVNMDASSIYHKQEPTLLHSTGLHPWHINQSSKELLNSIKPHENLLAIGECGLDKLRGPDLSIQKEVFIAQIELSEHLCLPLIIHCVKAYSEIIQLRKDLHPSQPWIFHGFNASKETMEQALKHGFYFSVGASLLKKHSKVLQSLPFIPHNRLFLETDDNPQLRIESIYEKASNVLNLELIQLQEIIQDNFKYLFNVDTRIHQSIK
ncbi:TatD family hydrolase [Carboxylicivirga sediminis]|uniref:TatD family hydrolase n=1 Tax=Carboxylicivirga sediminis TaxID=2006564 RepID=A0A941F5G6_9BACT|nr:TatD family hydrolase [Carboxylicivirga sediminis]MBR8536812.1 TatD family hydrolase [Carboxylicivirga sediminis]